MVRPGRDRLKGTVQVDEAYVGGEEEGVVGRYTETKAIVAIAVEMQSPKGFGRVRMQRVSGGSVSIEPAQIGGRVTYRVRVGPIANVTRADRLAQQISELGLETPRIVID